MRGRSSRRPAVASAWSPVTPRRWPRFCAGSLGTRPPGGRWARRGGGTSRRICHAPEPPDSSHRSSSAWRDPAPARVPQDIPPGAANLPVQAGILHAETRCRAARSSQRRAARSITDPGKEPLRDDYVCGGSQAGAAARARTAGGGAERCACGRWGKALPAQVAARSRPRRGRARAAAPAVPADRAAGLAGGPGPGVRPPDPRRASGRPVQRHQVPDDAPRACARRAPAGDGERQPHHARGQAPARHGARRDPAAPQRDPRRDELRGPPGAAAAGDRGRSAIPLPPHRGRAQLPRAHLGAPRAHGPRPGVRAAGHQPAEEVQVRRALRPQDEPVARPAADRALDLHQPHRALAAEGPPAVAAQDRLSGPTPIDGPPPDVAHRGPRAPLAVVILTHNEEENLPHALASVTGWAAEVWVVDAGSADRTVEIARRAGAQVVAHAFAGYAAQRNWALRSLPFGQEWVPSPAADEAATPGLRAELAAVPASPPREVAATTSGAGSSF